MKTKIVIVGAGNVGAHIVSASLLRNVPAQFFLLDENESFEKAQVLDLKDSLLFSPKSQISGLNVGDSDISDADIVVITAGAKQNPGESRCELLGRNVQILQNIKKNLGKLKSTTIVILVTNPVDILTQVAVEIFDLPKNQIFGTGTLLDSARLRWRLSEKFERNISDVDGFVLGEHGDSEFVAWSTVSKANEIETAEREKMEDEVKKAAYAIIEGKGSTYFGIGAATAEILDMIVSDSKKIVPLSVSLSGEYGIDGIALGVPVKLGQNGIQKIYEIPLPKEELEKLQKSGKKLKELFVSCPR